MVNGSVFGRSIRKHSEPLVIGSLIYELTFPVSYFGVCIRDSGVSAYIGSELVGMM